MPQELQVLRCYSCEAFQVHIVKKSSKWECKMCGEKQSNKKVYARGSGKDCRLYVQELNQKRLESNCEQPADEVKIEYSDPEKNVCTNAVFNNDTKPNRWAEFISPTVSSDVEVENEDISNYTFEQPIKKRRRPQLYKKCSNVNRESIINDEAPSHTLINEKQLNCATNNEMFNHIQPFKKHKPSKLSPILKEVDQESHIKEKGGKDSFSCALGTNKTPISLKSSKWAEFISTTSASSDEEIENYDLLSNAAEKPSEIQECFQDLNPNKANGNGHQILDTSLHTQECKLDVLHFQSSSKWNEFQKDEQQFDPDKMLTNPSSNGSNLKLEKGSGLFNDREDNLDSLFSF